MADSFYGGKMGISFVIKMTFPSVQAMKEAFSNGADYTDVWYGEYCLIDTPNKNHKDNGKIFKRGLNYQDAAADYGAIYVGQIVGPSSGTPYFQLNNLANTQTKAAIAADGETVHKRYPTGKDENGNYIIAENKNPSESPLGIFDFSTNNMELVPGKKDDGSFNDTIRYTWVNIREDNADADSWFYVGFEIPYMVTDYAAHTVSPYGADGRRLSEPATAARIDDKTHPFYEKWDLGLPRGIKGDSLRNLRVKRADLVTEMVYTPEALKVNNTTGEVTTTGATPGWPDMATHKSKKWDVLLFDFYVFDQNINPTPITLYLGLMNTIRNIKVADDGTLTIEYSAKDDTVFTKKIKWITGVTLDTQEWSSSHTTSGDFVVNFNTGDKYSTHLIWVKSIQIEDNGTVVYSHVGQDKTYQDRHIRWIENVDLSQETGIFDVVFNTDRATAGVKDKASFQLDWIDDVLVNESNGEIAIHHTQKSKNTTDTNAANAREVLAAKLKLITDARITDNGVLNFITNTGETIALKNASGDAFQLKLVKNIDFKDTTLMDDHHIYAYYNTDTPTTDSKITTRPLNWIEKIVVDDGGTGRTDYNWHMYILFADPAHRGTASGKDASGRTWVSNTEMRSKDTTWTDYGINNDRIFWLDIGSIKDQSGVIVGTNVDADMIAAYNWPASMPAGMNKDILGYLALKYPTGYENGKIVTYSPNDTADKEFYAYDYTNNKWYYLGQIATTGLRDALFAPGTEFFGDPTSFLTQVNSEGVIVLDEAMVTSGDNIPDYWSASYTGGF